eukprot:m.199516 g.199516  ORF g.199516 m.199516 type:complete len:147 (+) comp25172_c3_seq1:39-479(+)
MSGGAAVENEDDEFIPALGEYTPISAGPALADIPAALFTRGATREGVEVMQLQFPETHEFTLLRFLKAREGDVSKVPQCPCTCPFPSRTRTHARAIALARHTRTLGRFPAAPSHSPPGHLQTQITHTHAYQPLSRLLALLLAATSK